MTINEMAREIFTRSRTYIDRVIGDDNVMLHLALHSRNHLEKSEDDLLGRTAEHMLSIAAKSWASSARRSRGMGWEEAANKQMAYALDYMLRGLQILLANAFPDEENIADFYKFAAIYAYELDDTEQATALLQAALQREVPPKLRRELIGLLQDFQTPRQKHEDCVSPGEA